MVGTKKRVTKKQIEEWQKDKKLICVVKCRCGQIHEFRKKYKKWFISCQCGNNLIFACMINRINKVLYKSKYMYSDNIGHFDPYK